MPAKVHEFAGGGWVEMKAAKILKTPFYALAVTTGAKSFADNPVIGSEWLNRRGLHVRRCAIADMPSPTTMCSGTSACSCRLPDGRNQAPSGSIHVMPVVILFDQ